jgi:hypothetical protein
MRLFLAGNFAEHQRRRPEPLAPLSWLGEDGRLDLLDGLSGSELFENQLDRDPGASDYRFAHHNRRITLYELVLHRTLVIRYSR